MPAAVRPRGRLRLRKTKSAERDCCNYCQCLFHVLVILRRLIAPLMTIDREPHSPVTKIVIPSESRGIRRRNLLNLMAESLDSEPEWRFRPGMTLFCNRCGLHPVIVFGVDTFLYAWMTMSTLARCSTAHATGMTMGPANSSANCIRWWQKLCAAIVRVVRPKRIYRRCFL